MVPVVLAVKNQPVTQSSDFYCLYEKPVMCVILAILDLGGKDCDCTGMPNEAIVQSICLWLRTFIHGTYVFWTHKYMPIVHNLWLYRLLVLRLS